MATVTLSAVVTVSCDSEKPKHSFKRLLPTDYFGIQNFMVSEGGMGLSGSNLMVFALVYSYSHNHDASDYYGSADYASARLGISRASVQAAFKSLLEQQLICIKGERKSKKGKPMKVYSVAEDAVDRAIAEFEEYWSADSIAYQPGYMRANNAPKIDQPQDVVVENPASDNVQKLDIIENQQGNDADNVQKLDFNPSDNVQKLDMITKGLDLDLKGSTIKTNQPVEPPSGSDGTRQHRKIEGRQVGRFNSAKSKTQPIEPLGPEIQSSFDALVDKARNRNRIKYASSAYATLVGEGYLPAEIARAWGARCHDAVSNDWQDAYHPQLTAFLESPSADPVGARARIERYRKKRIASNPDKPPRSQSAEPVSPLEILASVDGVFMSLNQRVRDALRNHATAQILRMSTAAQEAASKECGDALSARLAYLSDLAANDADIPDGLARKCLASLDDDGREVSAGA